MNWYCPNCKKEKRFARPAVDVVGYATTGRVYKCWKCGAELRTSRFKKVNAAEYAQRQIMRGCELVKAEKTGYVIAREVMQQESFTVWTENGNVEGHETADIGEFILTRANKNGSPVIDKAGHTNSWKVTREKFVAKYDAEHPIADGVYKPAGGEQTFVKVTDDICFTAPWGEVQNIISGGYLNVTDPKDVYGIAAEEFAETYTIF